MKNLLGTLMVVIALLASGCSTPTSLPCEESRFAAGKELEELHKGTDDVCRQARLWEDG